MERSLRLVAHFDEWIGGREKYAAGLCWPEISPSSAMRAFYLFTLVLLTRNHDTPRPKRAFSTD